MFAGLQTKLIIAGVVLAVLGAGALYIRGVINENAVLKGNQRQLETALDLKDTEIGAMQDMAASRAARAQEANEALWAAQAHVDDLEEKLSKHDLKMLVSRKPETLTRLMQKGTAAVHKEMEEAANAPLNR